ncbi:hypothetical protein VNO78_10634 [Psophocarpus tetragonolobus]|uniref:Spatacsin C-terminal domain-containing protein n=1 Tax=Psophocarpus tetragonolobus TaxID=3891 RepID=A0AAN9SLM2_PSOTE
MDFPSGSEDPAILNLHKWDLSETPIRFSDFREAFLSPTRETLLLHSYEREALLLPLGELNSGGDEGGYAYDNHNRGSSNVSLDASTRPSRSVLVNDSPCTSGSDIHIDTNLAGITCSRSNSYPYISDVNSLAWACCEDGYDQHNDTSFREVLFVSGRCGVTVHAFPKLTKTKEMVQAMLEGNFRQGRWVEWGPIATLSFNSSHGVSGDPSVNLSGYGGVELLRGSATKRYLESFFTKVETIVSDGVLSTKFPDNNEFPCSTKVVSFSIFDGSVSLNHLLKEKSVQNNENWLEQADTVKDASDSSSLNFSGSDTKLDCFSSVFGLAINGFYECPRVFSSASNSLVGFFLTLMRHASVNINDAHQQGRSRNLLLVAKLDSWGIQWVSMVKLDERINIEQAVEWMDFQFSDNLLVCLNSSGLIVLYSAMSGEYMTHLNVLQACGLNPHFDLHGLEKLYSNDDIYAKQKCGIKDNVSDQLSDSFRRSFKRLVVASHTSLLAVVDECGVIYVISLGVYIDKNYLSEKLLPCCLEYGLGMLVGWGIGGSVIDRQAVYSNLSRYFQSNDLSTKHETVTSSEKAVAGNALQKIIGCAFKEKGDSYGFYSSDFTATSKVNNGHKFLSSDAKSPVLRNIFVPNFRVCEDDSICFSPLGISIFSKKKCVKNQNGYQLTHFNLQVRLEAHDDNFLDSVYDVCHFNGKDVIGEAIGCTFQGSFYFVREGGLSVYIPSISILSNFLPVEYIGYHQSNKDVGISVLLKDNLEIKEPTKRFSPWKAEVLDRVLLYEGTEVADQLCLKNGWDIKVSRIRQLQIALDYLKFYEIERHWNVDIQCYYREPKKLDWGSSVLRKFRFDDKQMKAMQFDDRSLEMLVDVDLAEEGILRLLFAAVYLILNKSGNDSETSAASRLLALATCFGTKMLHKYGLLQHKKDTFVAETFNKTGLLSLPPTEPVKLQTEVDFARKLCEIAHFLEIIRNLQCKHMSIFQRASKGLADSGEESSLINTDMLQEESQLSILPSDLESLDVLNQHELHFPLPSSDSNENPALVPVDSESHLVSDEFGNISHLTSLGGILGKKVLPIENPKEMMARWKVDNLDLKTVVKDALLSGRLPLAVLQLHLHQLNDFVADKEPHDTFTEVRDIGRAVAYELFLKVIHMGSGTCLGFNLFSDSSKMLFKSAKYSAEILGLIATPTPEILKKGCAWTQPTRWKMGKETLLELDEDGGRRHTKERGQAWGGESELAVATLQRLGENIESCLKQLLFGTVRRSLRTQIAEEMKRYGYLGPYEWKILDAMSLIESLYRSISFWKTYNHRLKDISVPPDSVLPVENKLRLLHNDSFDSHVIECGEIDGIVFDTWINISESSSDLETDEADAHVGYWAAAAVWFDAWDQRTVDRMILSQSFDPSNSILWESQLEYHVCRNHWKEVFRLLDLMPTYVLLDGSLQLNLDVLQPASSFGCNMNVKSSKYGSFLCSFEELDSVCMEVPDVQMYRFSPDICSGWMTMLMEEKLAIKFIFLKEYWEGTLEMIALLARSGFISGRDKICLDDDITKASSIRDGTVQALHKIFVHHCAQYNLPNLLDLYLDHHSLVLETDTLYALHETTVSFFVSIVVIVICVDLF